jgi:DUF4097 and DUF4098 domain-containing protein YvlB
VKISKWIIVGGLGAALTFTCALIVGILWASIGLASWSDWRWTGFGVDRVQATAEAEQTFTTAGPATLNLTGFAGNVTVTGGSGDAITVKMTKTAWGATQTEAEEELASLQVDVTQTGDTLTVHVQEPNEEFFVRRPNTIDFTIIVPTETAVEVALDLGDVTLTKTQGDVEVQVNLGEIDITQVEGAIMARSDFGSVTLTAIQAETVEARSSSGTITLTDVQAEAGVIVDNDFGGVTVEDSSAQSLIVDSNSGEIRLTNLTLTEEVNVKNDFGSVSLDDVDAAAYTVDANSGSIQVDGARGAVTIHNDFGEIVVKNATEATLDLKTNSGGVTFSGSLGAGPHTVASDFGGIELTLPADSALNVDLKTDFGNIRSAFAITARGTADNHWQGAINGGGASLTVKTNSGGISLQQSNP